MKQIFKKSGFTLIELLVVIVILGVLSTISVGTFRGYFAKARDAERLSAVTTIAKMIKMDTGGLGDCGVYNYQVASDTTQSAAGVGDGISCSKMRDLSLILKENDYVMPKEKNKFPYYYGFRLSEIEGNNDFFIAVFAEEPTPQHGRKIQGNYSRDIYLFVDGSREGVFAVVEEFIGSNSQCESSMSAIENCSPGWMVYTIDKEGNLILHFDSSP